MPTLLAAAGEPDVTEKLLKGHKADGKRFKVHLDGYDQTALLSGDGPGKRNEIFYFDAGSNLNAIRYQDWKIIFMEQRAQGTMKLWANPFITLRIPLIFNLRQDPYERAQITSNTYYDWLLNHVFFMVPAQVYVGNFLKTFKEYPPRQKAASFNLDDVMEKLETSGGSK